MSAGFSIVPMWLLEDEATTLHMVAAYTALASYADRDGKCWPSIAALARRAKIGETSLRTAIRALQDAGVLLVEERRRDADRNLSNVYTLVVSTGGVGSPGEPRRVHDTQGVGAPGEGEQEPLELDQLEDIPPSPLFEVESIPPAVTFEDFWRTYPRRVAKPDALRAWTKAVKRAAPDLILAGAAFWRDAELEEPFTPYPATWLNRDGWNDPPPTRSLTNAERAMAQAAAESLLEQDAARLGITR